MGRQLATYWIFIASFAVGNLAYGESAIRSGEEAKPDCGYIGNTKIEECVNVPGTDPCPSGMCNIGPSGGGGPKTCAKWTSCSTTSCGEGDICAKDSLLPDCDCFCYGKGRVEESERYESCQ